MLAALAAVILAGYVARDGFLGDDLQFVYAVQHAHGWHAIWNYIVQPLGASFVWRPMTNAFWFIEYTAFHTAAWAYHLTHITLFFCAAWLVYLIGRRVAGKAFGLVAALLFLVMPFHAEAIVWLSSVTDLLALLGSLLTIYLFIRYRDEGGTGTLSACCCAFFLAVCSKEFALMTPVVIALIDVLFVWKRGTSWKSLLRPYSAIVVVAGLYLALRISVLGNLSGSNPGTTQSFIDSLKPASLKMSIGSFLFLFNHAALSRINQPFADFWLRWRVYVTAGVVALLFVLNYPRWKDQQFWRLVILSGGLIVLFSLPVLPLLPHINENLQHTRFLYAPSVGVAFLLTTLLWFGADGKKALRWVGMLLIGLTVAVYSFGLAINLPSWYRATTVMNEAMDDIQTHFATMTQATTPTTLYIHAVPGSVDGAYAFHDLYSFRELFTIRFSNQNVTVVPVGRYEAEHQYSLCTAPTSSVHLLQWKGDHFDQEDSTLASWLTARTKTPDLGFTSSETFVQHGWKAQDMMVTQADNGIELSDFGDHPALVLPISITTLPSALHDLSLAFGSSERLSLSLAWKNSDSTDYSDFQSIDFAANGASTVSLCAYPNWFVGSELTELKVEFPKHHAGPITLTKLSFD